jgi:hypothetical protein
MTPVDALLAALALCAVHLFGHRLPLTRRGPGSHWLAFAGGTSIAYVFVHLLPELSRGQRLFESRGEGSLGEHVVHLTALGGLLAFYGLERLTLAVPSTAPAGRFWVRLHAFGLYNFLVGCLLAERKERALFLFTLGMGLHYLITDVAMSDAARAAYLRRGRWWLVAMLLLGWVVGDRLGLPDRWAVLGAAFVGGGVVLNVLKEELPGDEAAGRFIAFSVGAVGYAALLLAL